MNLPDYLKYVKDTSDKVNYDTVYNVIETLIDAREKKKKIFIIGNGGSAANASHFANDLCKYPRKSGTIKAISLTDNFPLISAYANDDGYETVFQQQLQILAEPFDVLIAISGSGNSPNIINAVKYAKVCALKIISLTGFDGGELKKLSNINIHVPINDMPTVESIHSILMHYIVIQLC